MKKKNTKKKIISKHAKYIALSKIQHSKGITLVSLVVTIIVLLILAGITIFSLLGDNGIIKKAGEASNKMGDAADQEHQNINDLADILNSFSSGNGTGSDTDDIVEMPDNWNPDKVTAVKSEDNVIVPVPIGFTKSTVEGEGSVSTGFVIKQGNDGSLTEGINEFVWVPVLDPSSMFGTDSNGNSLGKLYEFSGTSSSPRNWTESNGIMSWTLSTGTGSYREPDIVTEYDGNNATNDASYFTAAISSTMTGEQFKNQLQQEFEDMRDSVETYGGFYIGRYETGNLSQNTAIVQKNNTDISEQNWYVMYTKSKTIAQGTQGTSSMIWGCQWDATLRWFQTSSNQEIVNYATNSSGKGNYSGTQGDTDTVISTGSNVDYNVNNIYDMAGNVWDWTLDARSTIIVSYEEEVAPILALTLQFLIVVIVAHIILTNTLEAVLHC